MVRRVRGVQGMGSPSVRTGLSYDGSFALQQNGDFGALYRSRVERLARFLGMMFSLLDQLLHAGTGNEARPPLCLEPEFSTLFHSAYNDRGNR